MTKKTEAAKPAAKAKANAPAKPKQANKLEAEVSMLWGILRGVQAALREVKPMLEQHGFSVDSLERATGLDIDGDGKVGGKKKGNARISILVALAMFVCGVVAIGSITNDNTAPVQIDSDLDGTLIYQLKSSGNIKTIGTIESEGALTVGGALFAANGMSFVRAYYDVATHGGLISNKIAITSPTIPDNYVVVGPAMIDVFTAFTSTGTAAAISIGLNTTNDLFDTYATTGTLFASVGQVDAIPRGSASTAVKTTNDLEVTVTITTENITNGAFYIVLPLMASE